MLAAFLLTPSSFLSAAAAVACGSRHRGCRRPRNPCCSRRRATAPASRQPSGDGSGAAAAFARGIRAVARGIRAAAAVGRRLRRRGSRRATAPAPQLPSGDGSGAAAAVARGIRAVARGIRAAAAVG